MNTIKIKKILRGAINLTEREGVFYSEKLQFVIRERDSSTANFVMISKISRADKDITIDYDTRIFVRTLKELLQRAIVA